MVWGIGEVRCTQRFSEDVGAGRIRSIAGYIPDKIDWAASTFVPVNALRPVTINIAKTVTPPISQRDGSRVPLKATLNLLVMYRVSAYRSLAGVVWRSRKKSVLNGGSSARIP